MLQKDTMKLFEAHGTMCGQVIDTDMVEPFAMGETPNQTAQKLHDRAEHLRTLLSAVVDYAVIVVDDTVHNASVDAVLARDAQDVLRGMADDIGDVAGILEQMALRTAPPAVVETAPPVRIKELITNHLEELAGKDFQFLTNWARNHGVQSKGMGAFWAEFTVALMRHVGNTPGFHTGGQLPNQPG